MKRISKSKAQKIAQIFALGEYKEIVAIASGNKNYNYVITTTKGEFIVRFSSLTLDQRMLSRLQFQIKALLSLQRSTFPYHIPVPLKSSHGKYIEYMEKKPYWVYKKIQGAISNDLADVPIKELGTLIAKYHRAIQKVSADKKERDHFNEYSNLKAWLKELKKEGNKSSKDAVDAVVKQNLDLFERAFERISHIDFGDERIMTHSDWYAGNLVFNKNKITGLIDFDTYEIAPREKDLAVAIQLYCFTKENAWDASRVRTFLGAYEKIARLSKKKKQLLKDHIIRESCFAALFFHKKAKKMTDQKKLFLLQWCIESIQHLLKDLENKNYN